MFLYVSKAYVSGNEIICFATFHLINFSLWHNPPFHSSKYADWLSEKRRKCKPYMLFWLVVSHDLSSGQTNPDLELQDCSTITLQSNTAALEALLVLKHCVTRTNTHRPCTRAHTCTLLYFLLSTYCSAKSSLFSYQTQAPTHARTLAHPLYGLSPAPALYTSIFVCIISHWLQCKNTDAKQWFKLVINHKAEFLKESFDILGNMLILFCSLSHSLRLLKVTITIILMPICLNPTHSQVRMSTCGCKQLFPPTSKVCIATGSHWP